METLSPRGREPFLAWPGIASFRLTIPLSYLFFKVFSSVYGGASLLARVRRAPSTDFYFPWEMHLPFVPSWSVVYLSVPLLILLTPFILRTWRTFTPFVLTLTVETLIAGIFFLLVPVSQAYPPRVAYGFFGGVFHLVDRLNLDYNKFPSLHIAFAVTAAIVFGRRCGWLGRTLFSLWIVAVGASTLLIHEHQILDLATGLALGLVCVTTVQRRVSDDRFLDDLRVDTLCVRELSHLVRRHTRDVLALLRSSLPRWRRTRTPRVSYALTQHMRDVLGGKRKVPGNPEEHVQAILRVLAGGTPAAGAVGEQLAAFLATELDEDARRELSAPLRQSFPSPAPSPSSSA
jgi:hypothetical protein